MSRMNAPDLTTRLEIAEGILRASSDQQVIEIIDNSDSLAAARKGLWRAGYSDVQALNILDMPLRHRTAEGRQELEKQAAELRQSLETGG